MNFQRRRHWICLVRVGSNRNRKWGKAITPARSETQSQIASKNSRRKFKPFTATIQTIFNLFCYPAATGWAKHFSCDVATPTSCIALLLSCRRRNGVGFTPLELMISCNRGATRFAQVGWQIIAGCHAWFVALQEEADGAVQKKESARCADKSGVHASTDEPK